MPAITFFAMLKSARDIKQRENDLKMLELTNVAAIAIGSINYWEKIQEHYKARIVKHGPLIENKTSQGNAIDASSAEAFSALSAFFGG
jgi:hypothetical protein